MLRRGLTWRGWIVAAVLAVLAVAGLAVLAVCVAVLMEAPAGG